MTNIIRPLSIITIFLAGTAVGWDTSAVQLPVQNWYGQDAGSGTLTGKREKSANKYGVKSARTKTRTLTGCLQKGEDPDEFNFTVNDGGTWQIESDNVKLSEYVGRTVKIVGAVSNAEGHGVKEDTKEDMKQHDTAKHTAERGHITVTDLTTVSDTCKK